MLYTGAVKDERQRSYAPKMSKKRDTISIIVPIYNVGRYLDQCLTSIRVQSYRELDIILINDGSTDNSLEIMKEHAAADPRIRIVDKRNEGYGASCNWGLDMADGEWVSIVEPDDWIEQGMYTEMIAFAAYYEALGMPVDIVKTPYWRIWMPDTPQQRKLNCSYRRRVNPPHQPFAIADAAHLLTHHPSIWSAIYRRSFINEHDIRFKEIPGAGWADNPFLVETLCQTENIVYLDMPYYCYREETPEKAAAFTRRSPLTPFDRWQDMMDVLERIGVSDERVLRAHYSRGFTYLSGVIEEVNLGHEAILEAAIKMCERMDPELVFNDDAVSPGMKKLFARLRDIPCPPVNPLPHMVGLLKEGIYALRNTGVSNSIFVTIRYFMKRDLREDRKRIES